MMGFLFEGSEPTKRHILTFPPSSASSSTTTTTTTAPSCTSSHSSKLCNITTAVIRAVDDDPGALQSGHYLWPAAPALAQHLVDCYGRGSNSGESGIGRNWNIIELGAGCGLAG